MADSIMRTVYRSMQRPDQSAAQQHTCDTHKMLPSHQLAAHTFKVSPRNAQQAFFPGTGRRSTKHAKITQGAEISKFHKPTATFFLQWGPKIWDSGHQHCEQI